MASITYYPATPDQDLTPVVDSDLNASERMRVQEIAADTNLRVINIDGRDYEGILVVRLDRQDADDYGIYNVLYVYNNGNVALAGTNQPMAHLSFAYLLKANYNG